MIDAAPETLRERTDPCADKFKGGGGVVLGHNFEFVEMIPKSWREIHIAETVMNMRVRWSTGRIVRSEVRVSWGTEEAPFVSNGKGRVGGCLPDE